MLGNVNMITTLDEMKKKEQKKKEELIRVIHNQCYRICTDEEVGRQVRKLMDDYNNIA